MKVSWVERWPQGLLLSPWFPGRTKCFVLGFIDVLLSTTSFLLSLSALDLTTWERVAQIDHYRGQTVEAAIVVTGILTVLGSLAALLSTLPMIYVAYRRGKARDWLTLYQVKSVGVFLANSVALGLVLSGSLGGSWSSKGARTYAVAFIVMFGLILPVFEFLVVSHYELEVMNVETMAEALMTMHDKMIAKQWAKSQRKK